jgi:hypothetical protein
MQNDELTQRYNYASFIPENFEQWLNFEASPPIGQPAPDFPLWRLENQQQTSLQDVWKSNAFTVVEFGSFT